MELEVNNKGFTLIELLVGVIAFSVLMTTMSTLALSVIQAQRKAFALQNAQESSRFILESMIKEIRTSVIDSVDSGGGQVGNLQITNAKGESVEYAFFAGNKIMKRVNSGVLQDISPSNVVIAGGFYIAKGTFPSHSRVTVIMKVSAKGNRTEEQAEMYLQNTISVR